MKILRVASELLRRIKPELLSDLFPDIQQMIEENERKHLADLSKKYHIPIHEFRMRRQVFMDQGRDQIFDSGLCPCDSPVRNYYNMVFCYANIKALSDTGNFGTGYVSLKDVGGTIRGYATQFLHMHGGSNPDGNPDGRAAQEGILGPAGDDTLGLVIGTGSTAWDFEDYVLDTEIDNGSAGGEMDYAQSGLHSITNAVLTLKDTRIRDFNNNSGGAITVEEVGEYIFCGWYSASSYNIMLLRDLTGGDAVADQAQYRVTLESTLVYPA